MGMGLGKWTCKHKLLCCCWLPHCQPLLCCKRCLSCCYCYLFLLYGYGYFYLIYIFFCFLYIFFVLFLSQFFFGCYFVVGGLLVACWWLWWIFLVLIVGNKWWLKARNSLINPSLFTSPFDTVDTSSNRLKPKNKSQNQIPKKKKGKIKSPLAPRPSPPRLFNKNTKKNCQKFDWSTRLFISLLPRWILVHILLPSTGKIDRPMKAWIRAPNLL